MSPREPKPFFSKDRLKEYGVKATAIVALGAAGLGLAGCGPSEAGAEKPPVTASATPTPGANETPSATPRASETTPQTPSTSETSHSSSETNLSLLDAASYKQVADTLPLAKAEALDKEIVALINIPPSEWEKLSRGEQAYRAGLYVEMMNAWNEKNLANDTAKGTALDGDKTYAGLSPFMSETDFSKLGCKTPDGIAMLEKLENIRRGWLYAVGHSSVEGAFVPQIRQNIVSSEIYVTGQGNAETTETVFRDTDISKADVHKLYRMTGVCGFGLNNRQFQYATNGQEVQGKYGSSGIWLQAPANMPVLGENVELVATGHSGRFANVTVFKQLG